MAGDTVAPSLAPRSKLGGRQLLPSANDVVPEESVIAPAHPSRVHWFLDKEDNLEADEVF